MQIYKYVQSHIIIIIIIIIIIRQNVSHALATIISVSYNRNTISIQTIVKMYDKTTQYYIWYSRAKLVRLHSGQNAAKSGVFMLYSGWV